MAIERENLGQEKTCTFDGTGMHCDACGREIAFREQYIAFVRNEERMVREDPRKNAGFGTAVEITEEEPLALYCLNTHCEGISKEVEQRVSRNEDLMEELPIITELCKAEAKKTI